MALFGKKKKKSKRGASMTKVVSMADSADAALEAMEADNEEQDEEATRIRNDIFKMIDQGVGSVTDLWAPPRMKILYDNIELGDECLAIFTVSNWPESLTYGWLNRIIDDASLTDVKMDVSMHIHPIRKDYALAYMDDKYAAARSSAEAEYEKGKVREDNQRTYSKQMETATLIRSMLDDRNENLFQVCLVFGVYGQRQWDIDEYGDEILVKDAHEDLIEKTNRVKKALANNSRGGFGIKSLLHQQRDGIKSLLPLGYGGLHAFQNFYTSALATCYPFTQGSLQTDDGILYGTSIVSRQPIMFNVFNRDWTRSYNTLIIGTKGSGKSATAKTLLGRYAIKGTQIFIIDPALTESGEYVNLCMSLDGSMVDFVGKNGVYINPFELVPPSKPSKNPEEYANEAANLYLAKKNYLVGLIEIMREIYANENSVTTETESFNKVFSTLVDRTYQYKGIGVTNGHWDCSKWVPKAMPTIDDFYFVVNEYEKNVLSYNSREKVISWGKRHLNQQGGLLNKNSKEDRVFFNYYRDITKNSSPIWGDDEHTSLKIMKNILQEYISTDMSETVSEKSMLFSGKNSADLANQCVVFRFGDVSEKIKTIATYMCFELINSRITSGQNYGYKNKIIVLDEAWKLIRSKDAREYLESLYREGRKLNTGVWLISQSYDDFHNENEVFFNFADTKIIMSIPDVEVSQLIDDIDLSTSMADVINAGKGSHSQGVGILHVSGNRHETVAFYCEMSELESRIADTSDSTRPPMKPSDIVGEERARELGMN